MTICSGLHSLQYGGKRVDRYSETREFISTPVPTGEMSYIGGYFYKQ